MKLAQHESGRPLFILGTGRCGSTFWQTLLCRAPDTWIWGEHGGFLRPLLGSRDRLQRVGHLLDVGRDATPFDADDRLVETDGTKLAWMNGITPEDYDDLLRGFIDAYMRHGLPAGRSRWGFKEVRYGRVDEHTPRHLLKLFPGSHVIHALRHPRATIESAVRSWRPTSLDRTAEPETVQAIYDRFANRWLVNTEYLLTLADEHPGRVVRVRLEAVPAGTEAIMAAVGLRLPVDHPTVNATPPRPDADDAGLETAWQRWRQPLEATMRRVEYA